MIYSSCLPRKDCDDDFVLISCRHVFKGSDRHLQHTINHTRSASGKNPPARPFVPACRRVYRKSYRFTYSTLKYPLRGHERSRAAKVCCHWFVLFSCRKNGLAVLFRP